MFTCVCFTDCAFYSIFSMKGETRFLGGGNKRGLNNYQRGVPGQLENGTQWFTLSRTKQGQMLVF